MMKKCAECGAVLPTPLQEFGDVNAPLCQMCHLTFAEESIKAAEERREQLYAALKDFGDEREYIFHQENELEDELWELDHPKGKRDAL